MLAFQLSSPPRRIWRLCVSIICSFCRITAATAARCCHITAVINEGNYTSRDVYISITADRRYAKILKISIRNVSPQLLRRRGSCQLVTDLLRRKWCNWFWHLHQRPLLRQQTVGRCAWVSSNKSLDYRTPCSQYATLSLRRYCYTDQTLWHRESGSLDFVRPFYCALQIAYSAPLTGLPWVWRFPWVWVWDVYGDCDESPWACGNSVGIL